MILDKSDVLQYHCNGTKPFFRTIFCTGVLSSSSKYKKPVEVVASANIKTNSLKKSEESKKGTENNQNSPSSENTNEVISSNESQESAENKSKGIIKAVTATISSFTDDKVKDKVNLENVKEQSLEPKLHQKLKEKILDLKKDESKITKPESGNKV